MIDIVIRYKNEVVEFYSVPHKYKKAIETLLHGLVEDNEQIVSAGCDTEYYGW